MLKSPASCPTKIVLATLVMLLAVTGDVPALSVEVDGSPGMSGTEGATGGIGGHADAVAASGDATNIAVANGGSGGNGGDAASGPGGNGGNGGNASAGAETDIPNGTAAAEAWATGGNAGGGGIGSPGGSGGNGGDAEGSARAVTGAGDVRVVLRLRSGNGSGARRPRNGASHGGNGGDVVVGPVYAASGNGGNVDVVIEGYAGRGAEGGPTGRGGHAGRFVFDGPVDGDTTGNLTLSSTLVGGDGAAGFDAGGQGTSVENVLSKATSSQSISVHVLSDAGSSSGTYEPETYPAPAGGDAFSSATAINTSGDAEAIASAFGGRVSTGGFGGGDGGDGEAVAVAHSDAAGATVTAESYSGGGNGGGIFDSAVPPGGISRSSATATASGNATVRAMADTVASSPPGGSDAFAEAFGANNGLLPVYVTAHGVGGRSGPHPGNGQATAYGESTGGGNVFVTATQVTTANSLTGGGDSTMIDAVGGRTAGTLTITQRASAGKSADEATVGDAHSEFTIVNDLGGPLVATSEATGGEGNFTSGPGGERIPSRGGHGLAIVVAESTGPVSASADANGGISGDTGTGFFRGTARAEAHAISPEAHARAIARGEGTSAVARSTFLGNSGSLTTFGVVAEDAMRIGPSGLTAIGSRNDSLVISGSSPDAASFRGAQAGAVGAPDADTVLEITGTAGNIGTLFSSGAHEDVLAIFSMYTQVGSASANVQNPWEARRAFSASVDLALLEEPGSLVIGILNSESFDTELLEIDLKVRVDEFEILSEAVSGADSAHALFHDKLFTLGQAASLAGPDDVMDLQIEMTFAGTENLTQFDFFVVNASPVPIPAQWLITLAAFVTVVRCRRRPSGRH